LARCSAEFECLEPADERHRSGESRLEARHVAGDVVRPPIWSTAEVMDVVGVLAKPDPRDNLDHVERDRVL
jgi:hypothetical protein